MFVSSKGAFYYKMRKITAYETFTLLEMFFFFYLYGIRVFFAVVQNTDDSKCLISCLRTWQSRQGRLGMISIGPKGQ